MHELLSALIPLIALPGSAAVKCEEGCSQNLVGNGSFEEGPQHIPGDGPGINTPLGYLELRQHSSALTGWQVTRGPVDILASHIKAADGHRSVDLNGSPGMGGVRQTITTEIGTRYILLFKLAGHPFAAGDRVSALTVEVDGTGKAFEFDRTKRNWGNVEWAEHYLTFEARSEMTTIEFYSTSKADPYRGPLIDEVRVYSLATDDVCPAAKPAEKSEPLQSSDPR
jgi:choice-of-anchor C domain-containing protein